MQGADGRMSAESIEQLYRNGIEFEQTFDRTGISAFWMEDEEENISRNSFYYNFMDDEKKYLGRIVFVLRSRDTNAGIWHLLDFAAKEAEYCFLATMRGATQSRFSREMHELIHSVLEQQAVSEMSATVVLENSGWKMRDRYCVLKLISNGNVQSAHTLAYYCYRLEAEFPYICAIEHNATIYCMVNNTQDEQNQTFQKQLPYFLRENLFLAGISCTFDHFLEGALYAKEASYALAVGQQQNSSFWLHLFSDYTLDYCVKKMTEEYPAEDLIAPGLRILKDYDKVHPGTDLVITLREYLRQQYNATVTAENLHTHRTTFLYRLRRIEELTGMRLEEEKTQLHLQLSYALQESIC